MKGLQYQDLPQNETHQVPIIPEESINALEASNENDD